MKLISWNVNGIRAILKKDFLSFLKEENPDILCLQETRGFPENADRLFKGYIQFWNHAEKKGYSGTAIFVRESMAPLASCMGLGMKKHDREGRVIQLEYKDFYLVCVYTPNAGEGLKRLDYRMEWDKAFVKFLKKLNQKKSVIVTGDLNVAHEEIDLARPKSNRNNPGFTDEERDGFRRILGAGFIDSFRELHPGEPDHYTWWSYRLRARDRNIGWRIDYFCLSPSLRKILKKAWIMSDTLGSDHCPVGLELE